MRALRQRRAALAALLAAGVLVRAWTLVTWKPAFIGYYDTAAYVDAARGRLFSDPFRPAGYSLALRLLHTVSDRVVAVTLLQHAIGLATAGLLYLIVRDVARNPWWALLAPAVVLLDGFEVLIEHAVLSDSLFVFLLTGALYATLRARREGRWTWALGAGALVAAAGLVRTVGLFAAPAVLIAVAPAWRLAPAWAAAAAAVLLAYFAAQGFRGLSQASGWGLYARAGQFADCTRFRPPAGTRRLCQTTPPARRPGTDFYFWSPHSPAQRAFGKPPAGDRLVGAFAHAAIERQPLDYLGTVAVDFARYVAPEFRRRPRAGETQEQYLEQAQRPTELRFLLGELRSFYVDVPAARRGDARLTIAYVRAFQVRGPLMALLLALALAAPLTARGERRTAALALAATAYVLLLVPVATQVYDARYALAALGPLSAAAALALDSIRRPRRAAATRRVELSA
jgi:Dolichyl-phosphate-mannose-protein mannosyltransferase